MKQFARFALAAVATIIATQGAGATAFVAGASGNIVATFDGGNAGFTLDLRLFVNGLAQGGFRLNNQTSTAGVTSANFGPVTSGDDYYFQLRANGGPSVGGYYLYTDADLNGGNQQNSVFGDPLSPGGSQIFFDDTPGGAGYGDYGFTYRIGDALPPSVPEAATWAMMLVGFGAMGGAMRRRRDTAFA